MTTVPALQGSGPWYALLTAPDGSPVTDLEETLEKCGPEAVVSVSIRRDPTLPQRVAAGEQLLPGFGDGDEYDVDVDLVDEDGEMTAARTAFDRARAMAAGLNRAEANDGDFNRGTELAATLHDLADRLAAYDGPLPGYIYLSLVWAVGEHVEEVDRLALALIGKTGEPKRFGTSWKHRAAAELPGQLKADVYTYIAAPAEEDPAALRARIAELEQRLAKEGPA
jgi:hypothetical protein